MEDGRGREWGGGVHDALRVLVINLEDEEDEKWL